MVGPERKRILQNAISFLERTPFNNLTEAKGALQCQILLGELIKEIDAPPVKTPPVQLAVVEEKPEGAQ